MKIRDILAKNEPTLSFEVFPPKTEDKYESVEQAASEIAKLNPAFMSVTYGAGGGTSQYTVDIAASLKAKGVTPLAHLTCVSSTREKVHSVLDQDFLSGLRQTDSQVGTGRCLTNAAFLVGDGDDLRVH